ncbi:ComEA family DNA-binding protein [Allomuricauda sp. F6463D]|uniref:ComEA family DNA-binding protein n=1 Tax=Allomuricauda sp. F6463D TaxID=2926409 RepID=UPI001FF6D9A7|nr:helix-hairpin-helix domain-containing protein [Muricauda sp. F6463D]MCK0161941.1 helix-hairpin-helix domain-containing protein [Muricauda sp. F6463D]
MRENKSHFKFNKQERSGIFFLLLIVICLQGVYYVVKANPLKKESALIVNALEQSRIDSLKISMFQQPRKIYPFNPNYITDYKGYTLGLSTAELNRLFAYRKQGKFINSAKEFQAKTKISDSLLNILSPYFKFPDWVGKNQQHQQPVYNSAKEIRTKDLNAATSEDLREVYGIGEVLSNRIIKFRDRLGGFLVNEQLYDVYGLKPEVAEKTLLKFRVLDAPLVKKININTASANELAQLVYISRTLAYNIVEYKKENGAFKSIEGLIHVDGFPTEKLDRIALYLSL